MSFETSGIVENPAERTTATTVAGYLSSFAIFVSFLGIFWHPLRLVVPALLIALIASGMAGKGGYSSPPC